MAAHASKPQDRGGKTEHQWRYALMSAIHDPALNGGPRNVGFCSRLLLRDKNVERMCVWGQSDHIANIVYYYIVRWRFCARSTPTIFSIDTF
jgi:hypothetical protein